MGQTYSAFKTYVSTYLWNQNNTDLTNNLDVLIQQSDDELERLTRNFQRRQKTTIILPEDQDFELTTNVSDFQSVISLVNNEDGFYRRWSRVSADYCEQYLPYALVAE